jgi:hypothetical protein
MEWLLSPHLADLILVVMLVEGALLLHIGKRRDFGLRPAQVIWMLLPGMLLVLALRAALAEGHPAWIGACLAAAGAAHAFEVWARISRSTDRHCRK